MRIAIAGSSGLIGSALAPELRAAGHDVRLLVRGDPTAPDQYRWDPPAGAIDRRALAGLDAIVNLCGASLLRGRWTHARKQVIFDSRTEPTEVLADAVARNGIGVMVNASAVGYYGNTGSQVVTEQTAAGAGFLARLCRVWESATASALTAGSRVMPLRIGPVLAPHGGAMDTLRPLFSLALGGRLGDGSQYLPVISRDDAVTAIRFVLEHDAVTGPVNLTGPTPVTNAEFTATLARLLRRPAPWRAPRFALRVMLGELADDALLSGQRAIPRVLLDAGFRFRDSTVTTTLRSALAR